MKAATPPCGERILFASLSFHPPASSTFQTPVDLPASFSPNFRLATTQSWNLSVDQQFTQNLALHLSYVASQSYHVAQVLDLNPGYYGSTINGGRPTYLNFS